MTLPVRVLHLPMAFNERWTHGAIQKYMRSVRSEGPYLPSNVDFVAANNGLTGPFSMQKKRKEKSTPLDVITRASVPKNSPELFLMQTCEHALHFEDTKDLLLFSRLMCICLRSTMCVHCCFQRGQRSNSKKTEVRITIFVVIFG